MSTWQPYLHPSLGGPDFYLPRRESAFVFNHPGGSLGDSGVSGVGGRSSRDTMVSAKQGGSVGSNVANLSGGNSGGKCSRSKRQKDFLQLFVEILFFSLTIVIVVVQYVVSVFRFLLLC